MKRDNKIKVCRILAVVFLCFWTISGVRVSVSYTHLTLPTT